LCGFGGIFSALAIPRLNRSSAPGSSLGGLSVMTRGTPIGKVMPVHRRVPGNTPLTERHARQVGHLVIAWNRLQSSLFHLFSQLVAPTNHELAHGIWHCIQSDKTQREMLVAAAKAALGKDPKMREHVEWIAKKAGELSPYRTTPPTRTFFLQAGGVRRGSTRTSSPPERPSFNGSTKHQRTRCGEWCVAT
jgi:hypothetical protein